MIKKQNTIFIISALLLLVLAMQVSAQYNYDHVNVTARVNITNAYPEILSLTIDQDITLNAGTTKLVTALTTIRDWNGFADINNVNATFYYNLNVSSDPDDRNVHYTNASCLEINTYDFYYADYECTFDVYFFANEGAWEVNVSVIDNHGFTDWETNTTSINALFALNVTDVIDYGEMAVTETSDEINATVTNFGNRDINVSVLGYGLVEGDGIGLICDLGNNISVEYQRFSGLTGDYLSKTPLSELNQDMGITLLQPTHAQDTVQWITKWQLYVPPNPFGLCEGTVRFTAISAT